MTNQSFLIRLILELTAWLQGRLHKAQGAPKKDLLEILTDGYTRAHKGGVLHTLLGFMKVKPPKIPPKPSQATPSTVYEALEQVFSEHKLEFELSNPFILEKLAIQAEIATDRLLENQITGAIRAAGAETRAAQFAVRWGVQHGTRDAAENTGFTVDDDPVELLKKWVRLAQRYEHRSHHDALEGTIIPYSQKFKLVTPKKRVFLIHAPYDDLLPLSETFNCGHGIVVTPPENAIVTPWTGGITNIPSRYLQRNISGMPALSRPTNKVPIGEPVSSFVSIPSGIRYDPARAAFDLVDQVHGVDELQFISLFDAKLSPDTPAAYAVNGQQALGILVRDKSKVQTVEVLEEIAHMIDHQALGIGQPWGSEQRDSYASELMEMIKQTTPYKRTQSYRAGQIVRLQRDGGYIQSSPLIPRDLEYEKSNKEWFARAYVQYIAVTTGDAALLREIGALRTSIGEEVLYARAWADDEFEPLAREMKRILKQKRWTL